MTLFAWLFPTLFLIQSATQLPVAPPPRIAPDPELDRHLAAWKQAAESRQNIRAEIRLRRATPTNSTPRTWSGTIAWMRPNLLRLRLNYEADKTGNDYEAFICDGQSVFTYIGIAKTITEDRIWTKTPDDFVGPPSPAEFWARYLRRVLCHNPNELIAVKCLTGRLLEEERQYTFSLVRVDTHHIYLDVEPVLASGKADFQKVRLALMGPDEATPYQAVSVFIVRPNGDSESWRFKDVKADRPSVKKKDFQFEPLPGFKLQKAT